MTPVVEIERQMPYPVDKVFAAWIEPEKFASWFLPDPNVRLGRVEADAREGGSFLIEMIVGPDTLPHTGTYRRVVANREIAFTWHSPATEGRETLVEVTFEAVGSGTRLTLRHSGLDDAVSRERHTMGWTNIVATLDSTLAGSATS